MLSTRNGCTDTVISHSATHICQPEHVRSWKPALKPVTQTFVFRERCVRFTSVMPEEMIPTMDVNTTDLVYSQASR